MPEKTVLLGEINPNRRRRFIKHLLNNASQHRTKKGLVYRKSFVDKIDKLRTIKDLKELHKVQPKTEKLKDINKKIQLIFEKQHKLEQEHEYDTRLLSSISKREKKQEVGIQDLKKKAVLLQIKAQALKKRGKNIHQVKAIEKRIGVLHSKLGIKPKKAKPKTKKKKTKSKKKKK